jgi:SynChlorMet cassette protein ScmC
MPWAKEFAQILGLKEDTRSYRYKIFFCTKQEAVSKNQKYSAFFNENFQTHNNSSISFFGLEIRDHPSISTYLCLLPRINKDDRRRFYILMRFALLPLYQETLRSGGLILHAALLHHPDIGGIALLAPGGTGKSTCAKRVPPPWSSYSDDLILIVRTNPSLYVAHPLPTWSLYILDSSSAPVWQLELHTGLRGLFFLQKSDTDMIKALPKPDSVQWIYESSMEVFKWFIEHMTKEDQINLKIMIFSNACNLVRQYPSFVLKTSLHGYFWAEIEKAFQGDNHKNLAQAE